MIRWPSSSDSAHVLVAMAQVALGGCTGPDAASPESGSGPPTTTSGHSTMICPPSAGALATEPTTSGCGTAGCPTVGNPTADMDDDVPLAVDVYELKQDPLAFEGRLVELSGVTVTTPATESYHQHRRVESYFVQEPASGPFSGIRVMDESDSPPPSRTEVLIVGRVIRDESFCGEIRLVARQTLLNGPSPLPTPIPLLVEDFDDPASVLPYDGAIVSIEGSSITQDGICGEEAVIDDAVRLDGQFFPQGISCASVGTSFVEIVGPLITSCSFPALAPRWAEDAQPDPSTPCPAGE